MKKEVFRGSGVAIVTPMDKEGNIDYDVYARLIEFQIAGGSDAIVTCGTTGEASTLTDDEHIEMIRFTVEKVAGRVPVVAGTGSNDTAYSLMLSQEAKKAGADALLLVTPYYNKTSQRGLIKHFSTVADNVDLPVILYNVPPRTGMNILPETYKELSLHPGIVATKEANGDISAAARTKMLCGDNLALYVGNDDQITPFMSLGGIGVISVLANVAPRAAHDIATLYLDGKVQESAALQLRYLDLVAALFIDVNPIPVKTAVNLMGFRCGNCRLPLCDLSVNHLKVLKDAMAAQGLL